MNTKNNRRRRQSVARIQEAFTQQLQSRSLSEITVADICKHAGINRSTFYSNFTDIYDLADKLQAELVQQVQLLFGQEPVTDLAGDMLKLFRHIRDNQLFYKTYFMLGEDYGRSIRLFPFHMADPVLGDQDMEYHLEFFRGGFNALIKRWLDGGCKESPEQMNEIILREYHGRLRG